MVKLQPRCGFGLAESAQVFGTTVHATSHADLVELIGHWICLGSSHTVCFCNVHMVMEAHDNPLYREIVNSSDVVAPDGMPIVWYLRRHGFPHQDRVTGPDLMLRLLEHANRAGWKIGLLGSTDATLDLLKLKLEEQFTNLKIVYRHSPPFREFTRAETDEICNEIHDSGVQILFVGLGCPKQELWMATHRRRINCVMLGVGAAFQFNAGQVRKAPEWIQRCGMEWFFRLCIEPRRLWKRYAKHNPRFLWLLLRETAGATMKRSCKLPLPKIEKP